MNDEIRIVGAREHNLKNVSVSIPKNKVVVVTGVSGSGKSSLIFDTIFTEAQRQLLETFSAYARQRMDKMSKPDFDEIENISPVIVIDQKRLGRTPRSTVGTATELYNYLRLLFSRCGTPSIGGSEAFSFNLPEGMCPACKGIGEELIFSEDRLIDWDRSLDEGALLHPDHGVDGWYVKLLRSSALFDMDKPLRDFTRQELDQLLYAEKRAINSQAVNELFTLSLEGAITGLRRRHLTSEGSHREERDMRFIEKIPCRACGGSRINEAARSVTVNDRTLPELVDLELTELRTFLTTVSGPLADSIVGKMNEVLDNLIDIGVGYLSLNRTVSTLSGGESQRVKMARQLGCDLVNLIYILDEPSIGLHQKDIAALIAILRKLRDKGNSVIVVEHDPAIIENADHVIDIGPGAGIHGGEVMFGGTYEELKSADTVTGEYLRRPAGDVPDRLEYFDTFPVKNAKMHNLKNISVDIPAGVFVCVTGVAGSGKSTLVNDIFARDHPEAIVIDQSPVGRSSRSNPATYTGIFDYIRNEFSYATRIRRGLFSFNSKGACQKCNGLGTLRVEMHFLDDVTTVCDACNGKRYSDEVLKIKYKGKNIAEALELTIEEAIDFFEREEIKERLGILRDVGLGYLQLGQSLTTLSGGEAQRIKLASELHKEGNIYIMDEPTTGLHMADIERLLDIIRRLVEGDNTVIVIEHNLDVIKHADWIIDMGPLGGSKGGRILAQGTPETIAGVKTSYTGRYLKDVL